MAYAVLRCAHAQAQDTQVTVFLNFLFSCSKKGSLSSFCWSDRTNYQLLTRESVLALLVLATRSSTYTRSVHFSPVFTKCEDLERTAELSLLKSKKGK